MRRGEPLPAQAEKDQVQGVHGCHGRRERSVTQRMSRETGRMELHSSKRASSDGENVGEQRGKGA